MDKAKQLVKCRWANQYQGKREPKCGCEVCALKWRIAELERGRDALCGALRPVAAAVSRQMEVPKPELVSLSLS